MNITGQVTHIHVYLCVICETLVHATKRVPALIINQDYYGLKWLILCVTQDMKFNH